MKTTLCMLASALALATCAAAPKSQSQAAVEVPMPVFAMSQEESTPVRVETGQTFALSFQGRPGTGYSWALAAEPDKELLEFLGETIAEEERDPHKVGGAETFRWTFKALKAGETEIAMKYVRPWESDARPEKSHVFRVTIAAADQQ